MMHTRSEIEVIPYRLQFFPYFQRLRRPLWRKQVSTYAPRRLSGHVIIIKITCLSKVLWPAAVVGWWSFYASTVQLQLIHHL